MQTVFVNQANKYAFRQCLPALLLPAIGQEQYRAWGLLAEADVAAGALVCCLAGSSASLIFLYVQPEYRRQRGGTALLQQWEQAAAAAGVTRLECAAALPLAELQELEQFLHVCGFRRERFLGRVYTFNMYAAVQGKFMRSVLRREAAYLPPAWQCVRYADLTEQQLALLRATKGAIFTEGFAFDEAWEALEKRLSFAFFCGEQVVGYMTQRRLQKNVASIVIYAVNPAFKGAGVYILKHQIWRVHQEAPEILRFKIMETETTESSTGLLRHCADGEFLRCAENVLYVKEIE